MENYLTSRGRAERRDGRQVLLGHRLHGRRRRGRRGRRRGRRPHEVAGSQGGRGPRWVELLLELIKRC